MSSPATLLPILKTSPPEAADPDLERDAEALYDSVSELVRVYQSLDRDRICCHDISIAQCNALEGLARKGGLTLGELAAHLGVSPGTATATASAVDTAHKATCSRTRRASFPVANTPISEMSAPLCAHATTTTAAAQRSTGVTTSPFLCLTSQPQHLPQSQLVTGELGTGGARHGSNRA